MKKKPVEVPDDYDVDPEELADLEHFREALQKIADEPCNHGPPFCPKEIAEMALGYGAPMLCPNSGYSLKALQGDKNETVMRKVRFRRSPIKLDPPS